LKDVAKAIAAAPRAALTQSCDEQLRCRVWHSSPPQTPETYVWMKKKNKNKEHVVTFSNTQAFLISFFYFCLPRVLGAPQPQRMQPYKRLEQLNKRRQK
jgi:hypothetical protein